MFQHTAARRRLHQNYIIKQAKTGVSTHSRPKAAAFLHFRKFDKIAVSTHSRPKAAAAVKRHFTP